MNIEQFEVFRTIAEAKSFTKAAKILNFTQPAISAQIKLLEKTFNVTLFERGSNGVRLTEAGKKFSEYGTKVLALYEEMETEIARMSGQNIEHIKIGASYTAGNYILPCSIISFKEEYNDVQIRLDIGHNQEIIRNLRERTIDIGIIEGVFEPRDEFDICTVKSYNVVLVASPQNKWQDKLLITISDLLKEPFIAREEESFTRKYINSYLKSKFINIADFNIIMEMSNFEAIKNAVIANKGISLIPYPVVEHELKEGHLIQLDVKDFDLVMEMQVVTRANEAPTGLKKTFSEYLKTNN